MARFLNSNIAKKFVMGISGLFLVLFLLEHVLTNFSSTISAHWFNVASDFLSHNVIIQGFVQPILVIGVFVHFILGFIVEYKNRHARGVKYVNYNGNSNSTWMSRNMLWSGLVILAFLALHWYDFFVPELIHHYFESNPDDPTRYYPELVAKFQSPVRTAAYVIAFIFLMLHLLHGFYASFQSIGFSNRYSKALRGFAKGFAIVVPLMFIYIAFFHYINSL